MALDRRLGAIQSFNIGEHEYLTCGSKIQFPCLDVCRGEDQPISLSRKTSAPKLREIRSIDIIADGALIKDVSEIRRFFMSAMDKLLWLLQTRFDLSFRIIKCATEVAPALRNVLNASTLIKSINRAIKQAREEQHFISPGGISGCGPLQQRGDMCGIRISAFGDAGYAAMRGDRSVEASAIICGREVSRDGSIRRDGSVIDTYTRCISRCARSTLAAEAVACANTIELSIWHRACVTEILFGYVIDTRPMPTNLLLGAILFVEMMKRHLRISVVLHFILGRLVAKCFWNPTLLSSTIGTLMEFCLAVQPMMLTC